MRLRLRYSLVLSTLTPGTLGEGPTQCSPQPTEAAGRVEGLLDAA